MLPESTRNTSSNDEFKRTSSNARVQHEFNHHEFTQTRLSKDDLPYLSVLTTPYLTNENKMKELTKDSSPAEAFAAFVDIIKALRTPVTGCPWDLKQDHNSLKPYLIEECYEVLEAIEDGNDDELCKELGDVLLQSVLHAQVAADRGSFSITDVVRAVHDKMIRRHPHVFGDVVVNSSDDVLKNWEAIKQTENGNKNSEESRSVIAGVPKALPALTRSERLGEKAAQVGFDWPDAAAVWPKVEEELAELSAEITAEKPNKERTTEELGDLLFALCQLSRKLDIHPEDALRAACEKFTTRFTKMENAAGNDLRDHSLEQLETLWQKIK